jgi:ADP-ribosylglycohydrolase
MYNKDDIALLGNPARFSRGMGVTMADKQIKRGIKNRELALYEIGGGKAVVRERDTGKWSIISGGWGNDRVFTAMLGAACGDIAGSEYEFNNIKEKPEKLITEASRFTDDTVMTCAVAEGLRHGLSVLSKNWMDSREAEALIFRSVQESMLKYGRKYPDAGYGANFTEWLLSDDPQPYGSFGNGSAMRASYAGWIATSLEEAEKLAEISAKVTHDHSEGIKGAKAVAGCIYLLKSGKNKAMVRKYASQYYELDFSLDDIRDYYYFDVTCKGSVPEAIVAFLEGEDFADVIALAISIGGDSDTIAAIAGSLAETIYPIPQEMRSDAIDKMDAPLLSAISDAIDYIDERFSKKR